MPAFPLGMAGKVVHPASTQVPVTAHAPLEQVAERAPLNPVSQIGTQVLPLGTLATQSPIRAFAGRVGKTTQAAAAAVKSKAPRSMSSALEIIPEIAPVVRFSISRSGLEVPAG